MSAKYTKFKIGDLVCLSAYGERRRYNIGFYGHWGVITLDKTNHPDYPYNVQFLSKTGCNSSQVFHPRELKHFKPKNSDS